MIPPETAPGWLDRLPDPALLRASGLDARTHAIERYICRELEEALEVSPVHRLSAGKPLRRQGVDSITALVLKRKLERAFGVEVKPVDLLREESARDLAESLAVKIQHAATAGSAGGER